MTDSIVDLIDAHADVAIRFGPLPDSDLLHRPLGRAEWRLVAAPDYLARSGRPERPADLAALEQVRFSSPAHINDLRFHGMADPVSPRISVTAANGEAVRQFVLGGMGIARFSDFMIDADIASGRAVELFTGQLDITPLAVSALYLTRASGLRRMAVFLDWLTDVMADPSERNAVSAVVSPSLRRSSSE
ncbi:hypothetical protein GBO37_14645 [Paracoccus sp. 08]|nr:hypothetical protein [Paracoccus sp. 08]